MGLDGEREVAVLASGGICAVPGADSPYRMTACVDWPTPARDGLPLELTLRPIRFYPVLMPWEMADPGFGVYRPTVIVAPATIDSWKARRTRAVKAAAETRRRTVLAWQVLTNTVPVPVDEWDDDDEDYDTW